jgi:hypothetical protein
VKKQVGNGTRSSHGTVPCPVLPCPALSVMKEGMRDRHEVVCYAALRQDKLSPSLWIQLCEEQPRGGRLQYPFRSRHLPLTYSST